MIPFQEFLSSRQPRAGTSYNLCHSESTTSSGKPTVGCANAALFSKLGAVEAASVGGSRGNRSSSQPLNGEKNL